MCGIFGWQVRAEETEGLPVFAAALMIQNDARGGDSWGYSAAGEVVKGLGNISSSVPAASLCVRTLYAHTRRATHGEVSRKNAHPFEVGKVVGAHNGVVYNAYQLDRAYGRGFECDSLHIFAHIAERRNMSEVKGYGAVWYYEKRKANALYLARFNGGELAIADLIGGNSRVIGVAFSSTEKALRTAGSLAGWSLRFYNVPESKLIKIITGGRVVVTGDFPVTETERWEYR